jgi:hypothetical protein
MLSSVFTEVGVGVFVGAHGVLWVTEDFMRPANAVAVPVAPPATPAPTMAPAGSAQAAGPAPAATGTVPLQTRQLDGRLSWIRRHDPKAAEQNPIAQALVYLSNVALLAGAPPG